jgi:hypothetical protein
VFKDADAANAETDLVEMVMERYSDSVDFDQGFKDRAFKHWQQIHNILPSDWPFWSGLFEPETHITCYDMLEGVMSTLFPKDQYFDLEPVEDQDELQVELMREYMRFSLRERVKYKMAKYYQFQEATWFGNGVEEHVVNPLKRVIKVAKPFMMQGPLGEMMIGTDLVDETVMEFWPGLNVLSRFDCYPARTGKTIQEMPYFLYRKMVPLAKLKAMQGFAGYKNLDKLESFYSLDFDDASVSGEEIYDLYERFDVLGFDVKDRSSEAGGKHAVKYAELLYYWEAPNDGEGGSRCVIIGNREHLIKEFQNPHAHGKKPLSEVRFRDYDSQSWQGMGIPAVIEGLQKQLNMRINQQSDLIELRRMPMTLVGAAAGVQDLTELDWYPGASVPVHDINAIRERETPQMPTELFTAADYVRASIQRATKVTDLSRGVAGSSTGLSKGAETATGMQMLTNQTTMSQSFSMMLAEEQGIREGLEMIAQTIQQTMTEPQKIKIMGENSPLLQIFGQFAMVHPEDIQGKYNFYATGTSKTVDRPEQGQQLLQFVTTIGQYPEIGMRLKQLELATEVADMIGIKNFPRFIKSDEEMMMEQQQQQEAQLNGMVDQAAVQNVLEQVNPTQNNTKGTKNAR